MQVNIGGCKGWKKFDKATQEAWRTLDMSPGANIVHDLNSVKPFPLCNDVVSAYYASHVLEHVRMERQRWVFSEIHRTLVPGGKIRIVVPDLSMGSMLYVNRSNELMSNKRFPTMHDVAPPTLLGAFLCWLYTPDCKAASGHGMGYDRETLRWYLSNAGFKAITFMKFNQCSAEFTGKDFCRYADWCLYVEATS